MLCELVSAVLLTLGLVTPLGAAIGCGTMLVTGIAMNVKARSILNAAGGGEYPLFLAVSVAAVGFAGSGQLSVDTEIGLPFTKSDVRVGLVATVIAVCAGAVPCMRSRRTAVSGGVVRSSDLGTGR